MKTQSIKFRTRLLLLTGLWGVAVALAHVLWHYTPEGGEDTLLSSAGLVPFMPLFISAALESGFRGVVRDPTWITWTIFAVVIGLSMFCFLGRRRVPFAFSLGVLAAILIAGSILCQSYSAALNTTS